MSADVPIADRPPPVPPDARLALYFGGTFDPPHNAHVELPRTARDAAGADHLLYVPTGRNPLKPGGPRASDRQRLDMLALALRGRPRVSIWTRELTLDREPTPEEAPNYTVDSIRALRAELPKACAVRLLIGADAAATFHRWREAEALLRLADPLVMLRPPDETTDRLLDRLHDHWPPDELDRWRARCLELPTMDVASTDLRAALADGSPRAMKNAPLPEAVGRYIVENGLYRRD